MPNPRLNYLRRHKGVLPIEQCNNRPPTPYPGSRIPVPAERVERRHNPGSSASDQTTVSQDTVASDQTTCHPHPMESPGLLEILSCLLLYAEHVERRHIPGSSASDQTTGSQDTVAPDQRPPTRRGGSRIPVPVERVERRHIPGSSASDQTTVSQDTAASDQVTCHPHLVENLTSRTPPGDIKAALPLEKNNERPPTRHGGSRIPVPVERVERRNLPGSSASDQTTVSQDTAASDQIQCHPHPEQGNKRPPPRYPGSRIPVPVKRVERRNLPGSSASDQTTGSQNIIASDQTTGSENTVARKVRAPYTELNITEPPVP